MSNHTRWDRRLRRALHRGRTLRVLGVDDTPFERKTGGSTNICAVLCADTRIEGMLWGRVRQDGWNSTDEIIRLVTSSKFHDQLHLVLLDGIAMGGFNIVDLPRLAETIELPCVAVMRRHPDMNDITRALQNLSKPRKRRALLDSAGPCHPCARPPCVFQVAGSDPEPIQRALAQTTDTGHVPEPLRLAHLIGGAVILGQSGRRA